MGLRKSFLLIAIPLLIVSTVVGLTLGKPFWFPYWAKIRGERTVSEVVETLRQERQIDFDSESWDQLLILGLKNEQVLEVWGVGTGGSLQKLREFPFTGFSGEIGPKLKEGDRQIPEGIYRVEGLNPNSSYHLSIKLNYPNEFDRKMGEKDGRTELGSNIFIHGKSATIGCIPIGDPAIEELFLMVAELGPENVEVIVAPFDMRKKTAAIEIPGVSWEDELYENLRDRITILFPAASVTRDTEFDEGQENSLALL